MSLTVAFDLLEVWQRGRNTTRGVAKSPGSQWVNHLYYIHCFFRHVATRVDVLLLGLVGNMLEPSYEML